MAAPQEKKQEGVKEFVKSIAVALAIVMTIRTFAFEFFHVPTPSLVPTVLVGDFLFVPKFSYGYSKHSFPFSLPLFEGRIFYDTKPKRGDIAVFRLPKDPGTFYVKRVIGEPGDEVQMIQGRLHINGKELALRPIEDFTYEDNAGETPVSVPQFMETLPEGMEHKIIQINPGSRWDNTEAYHVPAGHYFMMGDNRQGSWDSRDLDHLGYVPEEYFVGRAVRIVFSTKARIWQVWRWLFDIRYERIGQKVI